MNKVLKFIGSLLKQGYATEAEKAKLAGMVAVLKDADQEAVADQADAVADLPEEAPEGADEGGEEGGDDDDDEAAVDEGIKSLFAKHAKDVTKSVKTEIQEWMSEQKSLIAVKGGIYNPNNVEKRAALNETLRKTVSAFLGNDGAAIKEMTTTNADGGYTIDSELSAEIRHLITEYGVARREMENVNLSQGSYKANDLVTDVTVYWVDEGAAIGSTKAVLGQETLTLKKLGAIVTMTNELLADTEIDLMSFVASRVAEGFAKAEDEAFFKGDGTASFGSFTGLLEVAGTNEVTMTGNTFASMDADDLLDMVDATPTDALGNGKFYYHRTIKSIIRKLKATDGTYIYQPPSQAGPATVWGYPEVLVEAMPTSSDSAADTSFVLFGDLRKAAIFGNKGGIEMARSNSAVVRNVADSADINTFTTDREAVRWTQRIGYIAILPSAVTKLTTNT
jgi:HK97 family phage major capsid protein